MSKPDTRVRRLSEELGSSRRTYYRRTSPDGEAQPDGVLVVAQK